MAQSRATIGYLSTFSVGDDNSPIGYTEMLEVKSITPNFFTVPVVDATHLKSPNATSEKKPGLIMPGTIEVTGNFIGDATQLQILTLAEARTVFPFKFTEPVDDSTKVYTATGNGFISAYGHNAIQPSSLGEFRMTMEITGTITEDVA
jgi:hypothetical protein